MMKQHETDEVVVRRRPRLMGPAAQARALAEATARLASRRQRDALPLRIETPRLVLRAPIRGDVPDLVRLADNRAIASKLSRLPSPYTRADGIGFVEIVAQRPDERPYAIVLNDGFIGIVGFSFHTGEPPELGYWLGEPHWGKGIMSEAARALLEAAFATRLFPLLRARALKTNLGSRKVLEKAGFVLVREDVEAIGDRAGEETVHYRLEAPKWR
ncbi:MAG: GNAT family N-acetyltransferase [Devosia sp.]|nr:GNAT family N-acetyltransferase [Devosia sp.]